MTTSDQEEQAERRLVQRNDQRAREQAQHGTTFKAFADADTHIPGRFEAVSAAHVVGSTETPKYPAASTPFQRDPVGIEPPTGYDINAMPDLENPTGSPYLRQSQLTTQLTLHLAAVVQRPLVA